ncbi:hypothetical protein K501DRAFT_280735, partial [Backusella circina FSU 941]
CFLGHSYIINLLNMIVDLPNEIIVSIARKLNFRDKLNVSLACSHFHDIVSQNCLYERVIIQHDQDAEDIVKRFERNSVLGTQVEHLELETSSLSATLVHQLPIIFPEVSRFIDISPFFTFKEIIVLKHFLGWKDTILHYEYTDNFYGLARLLLKYTFSNIHTLLLRPAIFNFDVGGPPLMIKITECLKNAPSLKRVELNSCSVTLEILEGIHTVFPLLTSLKLSTVLIDLHETVLPAHIVPVRQLTYFEMGDDSAIHDRNCVFLDYLVGKYPCIEHLKFLPKIIDMY